MQTEIITDTRALASLGPAWDRVARESKLPGPFCGFSWSYEWWRALGGGRELRVVVAKAGGEVVGVLPLFEEMRRGARTLAFIGSAGGGSDYLDVVAGDDRVRRALIEEALHAFHPDVLALDDFEETTPTIPLLRDLAGRHGGEARVLPRYPCPFIPIRSDWQTFLKGVSRRENLRRREKWLAAQPGYRIVCETDPAAVPGFLARFHRLHQARWNEDGGTQAFADGRLVRFHERVCERFADEGRLRLWTMWIAGDAVAVAYAFDDGDRSLYYQSGFAPAWGAKSAGLVLLAKFIEDAFTRGLREVDFLRGNESYKWEWTKEARRTVSVEWAVTERGRRIVALERMRAAVRGQLRAAIPEQVARPIARIVRGARLRAAG